MLARKWLLPRGRCSMRLAIFRGRRSPVAGYPRSAWRARPVQAHDDRSTPANDTLRGATEVAMSGRGRSSFSDSGTGGPGSRLGKPVYHVKKSSKADADLFTDSAFVYTTKTWWARMTSRTALETYQGTLNHLAAIILLTIETMAAIIVAVSKHAWALTVQCSRIAVQVGGSVLRAAFSGGRSAGSVVAGGGRATGSAIAGGARGVWGVMTGGARATRSVVAGGARATRSAVVGGTRVTKGAVAGGAKLTRRTVGARRGRRHAQPGVDRPTRQVERPTGPAGHGEPRARPAGRPGRSHLAAPPPGSATTSRPAEVPDQNRRAPQTTRARPPGARPAAPPRSQAPRRAAAGIAEARPRTPPPRPNLKDEQIFVAPEVLGRGERRRRRNPGAGFSSASGKAIQISRAVARVCAIGLVHVFGVIWSILRRGPRLLVPAISWTGRHWQYAVIPLTVSVVALMMLPIGWDVVGSFKRAEPSAIPAATEAPVISKATDAGDESEGQVAQESDIGAQESDINQETDPGISLPKISVPKLSAPLVTLPSVSLPAFVKGPVEKFDRLLSGSLVEPGSRVLVADIAGRIEGEERIGPVLALILEGELARGGGFTVAQRERTLILAGGDEAGELTLPAVRALSLGRVTGSTAIITGEITRQDSVQNLVIVVHDSIGDELYDFAVGIDDRGLLRAIGQAAAHLAVKLGGPVTDGDPGEETAFLTRSLPAARAYSEARAHLFRSEYRRAIQAAKQATAHDSAFAAAYRLLGEAYGLSGQRLLAQQALNLAWENRSRLSQRERMRLSADRDALAGRHSDAILGYDHLFSRFRDDVSALKSQAILQEMLGVRGGGIGNLRVAYSIDPVDWPPLKRVATFLGYRGRLPEFTSLGPADSE